MDVYGSALHESRGQAGNGKKKKKSLFWGHLKKKNPNHLDFDSEADVGTNTAYSNQQKELEVRLLFRGTESINKFLL